MASLKSLSLQPPCSASFMDKGYRSLLAEKMHQQKPSRKSPHNRGLFFFSYFKLLAKCFIALFINCAKAGSVAPALAM
jgi:hypothetical protein